jgi:hypothetical protein
LLKKTLQEECFNQPTLKGTGGWLIYLYITNAPKNIEEKKGEEPPIILRHFLPIEFIRQAYTEISSQPKEIQLKRLLFFNSIAISDLELGSKS